MGNKHPEQQNERQDEKREGEEPDSRHHIQPAQGAGHIHPQSTAGLYTHVQMRDDIDGSFNRQHAIGTDTTQYENEIERLRAESARLMESNKESAEVITEYRETLKKKGSELASIKQTIERLEEEKARNVQDLKKKYSQISFLTIEMKNVKSERDNLLTRYSALAGSKLTDGNANIADLSDENRPTKLAEQYSELYDNEWTELFSFLTAGSRKSGEDACHIIAKAFCYIYSACRQKAEKDMEDLIANMHSFLEKENIPAEILKAIKDQRKKHPSRNVEKIRKLYSDDMGKILSDEEQKSTTVIYFLLKSIDLCWMMAIQDPPIYVDADLSRLDEKFNKNLFKPYTATGKYIDYIIWPTLYLFEGGDVLCKGIAQGKKSRRNDSVEISDKSSDKDINISPGDKKRMDDRKPVPRPNDYENIQPTTSEASNRRNPTYYANVRNPPASSSKTDVKMGFHAWRSGQPNESKQGKNVTVITTKI